MQNRRMLNNHGRRDSYDGVQAEAAALEHKAELAELAGVALIVECVLWHPATQEAQAASLGVTATEEPNSLRVENMGHGVVCVCGVGSRTNSTR